MTRLYHQIFGGACLVIAALALIRFGHFGCAATALTAATAHFELAARS